MTKEKDLRHKIIDSALILAAERGWAHVTLSDIAAKAGLGLPDLHDLVQDKSDILALLGRAIDRRVLETMEGFDPATPPRERLFDLLMNRYEALNEAGTRAGVIAIWESFKCDPKQMVISCPHIARSMSWMLEAAGVETSGIKGAVKVAGLTALYLKGLRVWSCDESADLGKTMSALDKDLSRAEHWAGTLGF